MSISEKLTNVAENVQKVYDAGIQAQHKKFWDNFQYDRNENYPDYSYRFASPGWNSKNFKPKYDIKPHNANHMFYGAYNLGVDLREIGVDVDFSKCNEFNSLFAESGITATGVIDTRRVLELNMTFYGSFLHTIEKLILREQGDQTFSGTFGMGFNLTNITIEGVIGNNIVFQRSPLTKDSIMGKAITEEEYEALSDTVKANNVYVYDKVYYYGGIITALSSTATNKTIDLYKPAVNKAFGIDVDDEATWTEEFTALRNSKSNWTFSYM